MIRNRNRDAFHNGPLVISLISKFVIGAGVKTMSSIIGVAVRAWSRVYRFLTDRNEQAVDAWGASLQYKRRYTNPDDAVRARKGA